MHMTSAAASAIGCWADARTLQPAGADVLVDLAVELEERYPPVEVVEEIAARLPLVDGREGDHHSAQNQGDDRRIDSSRRPQHRAESTKATRKLRKNESDLIDCVWMPASDIRPMFTSSAPDARDGEEDDGCPLARRRSASILPRDERQDPEKAEKKDQEPVRLEIEGEVDREPVLLYRDEPDDDDQRDDPGLPGEDRPVRLAEGEEAWRAERRPRRRRQRGLRSRDPRASITSAEPGDDERRCPPGSAAQVSTLVTPSGVGWPVVPRAPPWSGRESTRERGLPRVRRRCRRHSSCAATARLTVDAGDRRVAAQRCGLERRVATQHHGPAVGPRPSSRPVGRPDRASRRAQRTRAVRRATRARPARWSFC